MKGEDINYMHARFRFDSLVSTLPSLTSKCLNELAPPRSLEPHLSMTTWNARAHTENGFQQIRKIFDYTVPSKVTKILLVKDHARNGKEPFCVKIIESTCATFAVGQFN